MQRSPSEKLEVAFVANSSTQKVVANMEVDRKYNACKALDPQIDNEDDVQHSSRHYEINEQELQTQMRLGGLHGCNDWAGRTGRSGLVAALYGRGGLADGQVRKPGRGGLGRTGGLADRRTGRIIESWTGRTGTDGAGWAGRGGRGGRGRTGRTWADGADWGTGGRSGRSSLDGADCGRRGGLGRMGQSRADGGGLGRTRRTGRRGAYWVELGGA